MDPATAPVRPNVLAAKSTQGQSQVPGVGASVTGPQGRRKGHRGGKKKKKNRHQSFAAQQDEMAQDNPSDNLGEGRDSFYRTYNLSNESLESEALLDHREQKHYLRPRRPSMMTPNHSVQPQHTSSLGSTRMRTGGHGDGDEEDSEAATQWGEGAPLLSHSAQRVEPFGYGSNEPPRRSQPHSRRNSSMGSGRKKPLNPFGTAGSGNGYNVNYPPSVPGTPTLRASDLDMSFGDVMMRHGLESRPHSPGGSLGEDAGRGEEGPVFQSSPLERRSTIALKAEEDVCFPQEALSEMADEELRAQDPAAYRMRQRRRHAKWPDLAILDEWSQIEKEGRSEERRAKKITEPQLINGRLRPVNSRWYRSEDDAPYRFTYFNDEFQSTIHSQTISELVQPGGTFKELFLPDPPLLSDSSDDEDEDKDEAVALHDVVGGLNGDSRAPSRQASLAATTQNQLDARIQHALASNTNDIQQAVGSKSNSGDRTPSDLKSPSRVRSPPQVKSEKPPKYGDRPVWWLDILSPTEAEMKVISKTFGIHPLTAEDIMVQEQREKVELFRHYYFVNYRTFDQDPQSEHFLEGVNMYVVVFREGVLSFHFSMTPHPANVRRRIRQLRDYLILSPDWISYAIIDDITDAFGPLIQQIEDEVDDIDDAILALHSGEPDTKGGKGRDSGKSDSGETTVAETGSDMLRRVGDCRKRVMGLYRLLGNKADVIKGFAKRCNEHWEVAPRSEIGLYLGDIQDHIVTMTSNLSHYEKILSRSHGNYLAQINIKMNERQEQTADVLGRLTVLGTIVLPMNIITGLWGMNVWVPGQEHEGDLRWFLGITGGLLLFGIACYWIAKRVYGIM